MISKVYLQLIQTETQLTSPMHILLSTETESIETWSSIQYSSETVGNSINFNTGTPTFTTPVGMVLVIFILGFAHWCDLELNRNQDQDQE